MERLRNEYKERSQRLYKAKTERPLPAGSVPRGESLMENLTPCELSQIREVQVTTGLGRLTIPDSCDTLGNPVVEKMTRQLVEAAGRLVDNRNVTGSRVTAPYGTIDDTGRVEFYSELVKKTGSTQNLMENPENLVLSLTRLRDFLVERGVNDFSLP